MHTTEQTAIPYAYHKAEAAGCAARRWRTCSAGSAGCGAGRCGRATVSGRGLAAGQ